MAECNDVVPSDRHILLILGRANQVKYATVFENIEHCKTCAVEAEDVEQLIASLLEFAEQMEKNGEETNALTPLIKCFELSKRLDVTAQQAQKMLVLARLMNKLDASVASCSKENVPPDVRRQINKAKTALYTTLAF